MKTYQLSNDAIDKARTALFEYYGIQQDQAIRKIFDGLGSTMGSRLKDAFTFSKSEQKKKDADFILEIKAEFKMRMKNYNTYDLVSSMTSVVEYALKAGASKLPVPGLEAAITYGAQKLQQKISVKAFSEADRKLYSQSGAEKQTMWTTDEEVIAAVSHAVKQYKEVANRIGTLPKQGGQGSVEDLISLPKTTWAIREASSHLNVTLDLINNYVIGVKSRMIAAQEVSNEYRNKMHTGNYVSDFIKTVAQTAYIESKKAGQAAIAKKQYESNHLPIMDELNSSMAASKIIGRIVAHAAALGYYDAGFKEDDRNRVGKEANSRSGSWGILR